MNIKTLYSFLSLIIFTSQATAEGKPNNNARTYYKPVTVVDSANKNAKTIGIYQRAQIGNDGAYGLFTHKGKPLSQTVLEHNPTTTPLAGITDKPAIGYIQNTNPGAGSLAGAPSYLGLYAYTPALTIPKKAASNKPSMKMKTAKYTQAK